MSNEERSRYEDSVGSVLTHRWIRAVVVRRDAPYESCFYPAAIAAKTVSRAATTHAATTMILATEYGAEPVT